MDTIFFIGETFKDKNPKSINTSSRKWDDSENSSKSSLIPELEFTHSTVKFISKNQTDNFTHNFQNYNSFPN